MSQEYSIAQARDQLSQIVHTAEQGVPIHLTRYGKPVAVILSQQEFTRLQQKNPSFWEALQHFRQTTDLETDDHDFCAGVRSPDPGRPVAL